MRGTIETLLNLAQFKAGLVPLDIEGIDIGEIVAEAVRDAVADGRSSDRYIGWRLVA